MKALCYHGPKDIRHDTVPDPRVDDDRDAVIRMRACSICGSDLHIFHGLGFTEETGYCVGHEAVGEVVEIGSAVKQLRTGDLVMLSGAAGCGACVACLSGNVALCSTRPFMVYGTGNRLQGCQAEAVRVPAADFNAARIPDGVSLDQGLLLTDSLPTAWFGCVNADIGPGKTVVVIGLGPIGLMAVECALLMGADRVFALDLLADRRAHAVQLGATALDSSDSRAVVSLVSEATKGRMAGSVVEAVGNDVTIQLALRLAGLGGTVSVIGAPRAPHLKFPIAHVMARNITLRVGVCSPLRWWSMLVPLLQQGRLRPERQITHRLPLSNGADAYKMFDERRDGVLKTVLVP